MRRPTWVAFSVWFYCLVLLASVIAIPAFAAMVAVSRLVVPRRRTMSLFRLAIRWWGMLVCALLFPFVRIRVQDEEPSRKIGGAIVIANHRAASDVFVLARLQGEGVSVVNLWPMRLPVLGLLARQAGFLSVREMSIEEFVDRAARLLAQGVGVVAFPEGTRSGSTALGPFHGAMFRLGLKSRAPIVPVCIAGSEQIPPRGTWILQPGVIRVRKLPALLPEEYGALDAFHLKNRVRERIAATLAEMDGAA